MNLQKVNDWVSKNIPFLIFGALLLGLLFPKQLGVFSPYVSWMMVFQTFANSLGGGFRDLGRALTHPKPVLLTLGILHLLMPLIALGIGSALFPQDPLYTLSLVLVESSPAAVSAAAALAAQYFPADVVFSPSISPVFSQLSVSIAMRFLVRGRPQPEKTKHNTPQSADSSAL